MLDEARKREKVANAILLATLAASASQSPKDFVRTGHIESPGTALMQMFGKKRAEAERNLDNGRVVPKNKKMKTFKEFVEESYLHEMRKVDKVAGKKRTPLYLDRTHKTIQPAPEGSGKKWERRDIKVKRPNPDAVMGRIAQGMSAVPGEPTYADSGYARGPGFGYGPHPHGIGGEKRGVKRTQTIQQRITEKPKLAPGVDPRTPAQKVEDRRKARAASSNQEYGRRF